MSIIANRFGPDIIKAEIQRWGATGRVAVLVDQDCDLSDLNVEVIDVRSRSPDTLALGFDCVFYAVDQDDLGAVFVRWMIEHRVKYIPIWRSTSARYVNKNRLARAVIEAEFDRQTAAGFAKFDADDSYPGYGDAENICQALERTRSLPGAYVEVGCYRGSSGCVALHYMRESGIYRPTVFLDVFEGFTYEHARTSADRIWDGTHAVEEGIEAVAERLKAFEQAAFGRTVTVLKSNIITDELPPGTEAIAVANLDVDMAEAVYAGLVRLAPRIVAGGILIVEDPGHTPLLIGAVAALDIFLGGDAGRDFVPIYMRSGQYFLVRVGRR
jgi:hypothetical protein